MNFITNIEVVTYHYDNSYTQYHFNDVNKAMQFAQLASEANDVVKVCVETIFEKGDANANSKPA